MVLVASGLHHEEHEVHEGRQIFFKTFLCALRDAVRKNHENTKSGKHEVLIIFSCFYAFVLSW